MRRSTVNLLLMKEIFLTALVVVAPILACSAQVTFIEYPIPTGASQPWAITAGADGNLWFTESRADNIGRITPAGVITEFSLPKGSVPYGITAGPDGNVWFLEVDLARPFAVARPLNILLPKLFPRVATIPLFRRCFVTFAAQLSLFRVGWF